MRSRSTTTTDLWVIAIVIIVMLLLAAYARHLQVRRVYAAAPSEPMESPQEMNASLPLHHPTMDGHPEMVWIGTDERYE